MTRKEYWIECAEMACSEAGIAIGPEQIKKIAQVFQMAYENHSLFFGDVCIPNPKDTEVARLERELKNEKEKVVCQECSGKGHITDSFGPSGRSSTSQCHVCMGEGYRRPK